jgi:hypothetical protein
LESREILDRIQSFGVVHPGRAVVGYHMEAGHQCIGVVSRKPVEVGLGIDQEAELPVGRTEAEAEAGSGRHRVVHNQAG